MLNVYTYLADSMNVVNTLADVETDFELSQKQEDEHGYFEDYFNLLLTEQSANKSYTDLDSSQLVVLTNIINNANGKVKSYARNLLYAAKGIEYKERIIFPGSTNKTVKVEWEYVFKEENEIKIFKVYPNPAREYISVEYNFDFTINNTYFEVTTHQGTTVLNFITSYKRGVYNIDLRDWNPGTYIINMISDSKTLQSEKFMKF